MQNEVFGQVKSASDAIRTPTARPAYIDVFAPDYKPQPSPFARGFKSQLKGAKAAAGGVAALAGEVTGIEPLKQYGLDVSQRAGEEAAQLAMPVEEVDSVSSGVDFAKYALGYGGGSLLTMLATGGLGRAGGAALARGVPAAAEKLLLKNAGAAAGVTGGILGQEVGAIYPEAVANGVPDPVARSVLGGAAATSLDLIGPAVLARKLGLFGKTAAKPGMRTTGEIARGAGKGAAVQVGIEAPTEVAQTAIERAAAGSPLTGEEALSDYLNAAALAAVPGAVTGGVAGGIQASRSGATPVAQLEPAPAPPAAPALVEAQPFAGPPEPTPFQATPASALEVVQEPDRLALQDTSLPPVPVLTADDGEYQPKTGSTRPTIIGEQPTAAEPQDIITLEQDKILRQARGAQSVETQLALSKKARGALLSSDEAKAVRQYEATAPKVEAVISSSRGTVKQPGGVQARENFVNAYTAGVEKTVADLAAQVQMAPAKLASIKTALNRAAERAVKEDTPEKAQQVLSAGFEAAMKGKLPQQDIDTFAQKLTEAVTAAAPEIVQRNFSQAAIVPTDKVVFSHWGNVPGGTTDPTKIGTGVPGVDQAAASAVGLAYTSAVVRGSAYTEPAVTSRTPFVGQLPAEKVYQADKNDPLLAQARAEIAPQFGPDENVAWMQYAKKVRDLGYDAIQYANGQLRVFTAQPVFQAPRAAEIRKAASVAAGLHSEFDGSSYNVVTGQNLAGTKNYAVSSYKSRELIIPGKDVSAETFEKFIKANEDLLGDPRNILGSWFSEEDGNTYIDVSSVSTSLQDAMRIAINSDQAAIFDLRSFTTIPVGHDVFNAAQEYVRSIGMQPIQDTPYIDVPPALGAQIAKVYDGLQERNPDAATTAAYTAFASEIEAQYAAASKVINIERWTQEGQPYADSAEMRADVFNNNHIWVFEGGEPHPFLTQEQNTQFRAVHDLFGHAKTGFEFGPRGELNATRAHAQMFSKEALPALVTETIGQNSWVNFGEANAGLSAEQRAFAVQKADLLPESLWAPLLDDVNRAHSRAAQRFHGIMAHKGVRMLEALESIVGTPSRLTAKVVARVEGGTGVAKFSPAYDIIELSIHAKDGTSLAAHEGYHYLETRVLSPTENTVVQRAFKRNAPMHKALMAKAREYDKANGTNISAEIMGSLRESTAYGFEFWNRGEFTVDGALAKIWQKIARVMERVANAVHGLGFQSHEDIFTAIKAGAYARQEVKGLASYAQPAFSTAADEMRPIWFEAGRRVGPDALEGASGDAPYILEGEDYAMEWRVARVPIGAIQDAGKAPEPDRLAERLRAIRASDGLERPIYQLLPSGGVKILDGWHRLQVAKERGETTVEALVGTAPSPASVVFSQAATDASLADLAQRAAAGEIPRTDLNIRIAELLDDKTIPSGLRDKFLDPATEELRGYGGSAKRFLAENISSGQHLSRKSVGYKNVFGTLTSYVQRKNVLIADAVEQRLSTWVTGANKQDKVVVSAALLTRTENAWTKTSSEYMSLRSGLTDDQRAMFDQATEMINSRLDAELAAETITYRKLLTDDTAYSEWYSNRYTQVEQLKENGYFPERRFGDHVVHAYVVTPDGKKVTAYFAQHEREADARRELDELNRVAGDQGLTFEYGYRYKADFDGSISFGQFLTTAERVGVNLTQPEKERIAKALVSADSTRRNRIFRRQNIAGYSQDGMRILAEFGVTMANKIAYAELGDAINDAMAGRQVDVTFNNRGEVQINTQADTNMWEQDGENAGFYRSTADRTVEFVLSPRQGSSVSSGLRAAATVHFLGGSIAAGMVNMTSIPMNTVPWLTQHTSYTDAMGKALGAMKTAAANFNAIRDLPTLLDNTQRLEGIDEVEGLRHALQVAAQDGTILDTEIYQIMGLSRGQEYSFAGSTQKAVRLWMAPFRLAEQMNRMTSFIAAYKIAKEKNLSNDDAYALAQDTVYSTQFRYDDANRPGLARGDIGSLLFVFKSYPIFVLETMTFLAKENPRAAAFMLGSIVLTAGLQGIPFAEDMEDLIDTIAQRVFGSSFNTQRWLRNTLKTASEAAVGTDLSSVFMHGAANTLTELNFASRVGLGNLIPGTRIGAADADYKSVMTEIIGPVGTLVGGTLGGVDALNRGQFVEAARKALPLGAQNFIKGAQSWNAGFATDIGGRKLVDVGGWEAFWQSLGFSSAAVSDAYTADRIDRQTVAFYNKARQGFQSEIVKAVRDGDSARVKEAVEAITAWNRANPDMTMSISSASVRRQVIQAGMTVNERTLSKLPKQLRGQSEAALGLDEE